MSNVRILGYVLNNVEQKLDMEAEPVYVDEARLSDPEDVQGIIEWLARKSPVRPVHGEWTAAPNGLLV